MGQTNDGENGERRKERIFELALRRLDERVDRLKGEAAEALGKRVDELMKEPRTAYDKIEAFRRHRTTLKKAHANSRTLGLDLETWKRIERGSILSRFEIGDIGEATAFQHLKSESEEIFVQNERVRRYFRERGLDANNVEEKVFPGKRVHGHGPDFYFACRKTGKAVGIVEVKVATNHRMLTSTLGRAIVRTKERFSKDKVDFVKRRYNVDLGEVEFGLAIGMFLDPNELRNPDYEFSYMMAIVGKDGGY